MFILYKSVDMQEILYLLGVLSFPLKLNGNGGMISLNCTLCISLQNMLDMPNMKLPLLLAIHFAHGYICNCTICSRAFGLLHRNKHYLILSYLIDNIKIINTDEIEFIIFWLILLKPYEGKAGYCV